MLTSLECKNEYVLLHLRKQKTLKQEKAAIHGLCLAVCEVWSTINSESALTSEQRTDLLIHMAMALESMDVSDEEFQQLRETTREVLAMDQVGQHVLKKS